jgi:hypothetical protein
MDKNIPNSNGLDSSIFKGKNFDNMIEILKKDKSIVPKTIDYINSNQQIKRNAEIMRHNLQENLTMGQDVPLARRKKMANMQEAMKSMAKHHHKEGEVRASCIALKGKLDSTQINIKSLDEDKYLIRFIVINGILLASIANVTIKGKNKKASDIIGELVCGPIIFVKLNDEYEPENMTISEFEEIIDK